MVQLKFVLFCSLSLFGFYLSTLQCLDIGITGSFFFEKRLLNDDCSITIILFIFSLQQKHLL